MPFDEEEATKSLAQATKIPAQVHAPNRGDGGGESAGVAGYADVQQAAAAAAQAAGQAQAAAGRRRRRSRWLTAGRLPRRGRPPRPVPGSSPATRRSLPPGSS